MILTCPECATSYFVDDLKIPRGGRMVKCTSCGANWRAFQDRAAPEVEPPEEEMLVEPERPPAPPEEDLEFVAAPVTPERKSKPAPKKPPLAALVAGGVAAGLIVMSGVVVLARQPIAEMIPATAPVFAAIGLPVNTVGLVIEQVKSQPTFQGGRPVLSVTGAIRNVRDEAAEAPPIRVSLLDANGKAMGGIVAQPLNGRVPPGARRYFAVSLPDPPAGARQLEVAFAPAEKPAAATEGGGAVTSVAVQGPEPEEARPLPPGSPDALQNHE
ncbi:MAG: MJ0042-type zinc finger domain-containing protein [Pseudomonadota bacterium]